MPDTNPSVQVAAARCPRCGSGNRCALTAGLALAQCWCRDQPATLPLPASADTPCYCASCLQQLLETGDAR